MPSEAVIWAPLWTSSMPDWVWSRLIRVSSWTVTQVSFRLVMGSFGNDLDVAGLHEVVEGLGGLLLVDGVGVDGVAEGVEVFAEDSLVGAANVLGKRGDGDGGEYADDDHDDHQFEEGESGFGRACGMSSGWMHFYHVEYFVPSRPVP